ncbi:very-long-chain aldehyde decarbonylase CER1 [Ricinus communis]|uniref:Sterol desaturase, putative n=1 Tax=Ricinus communis TaxID=3988 RepID=B9SKI2_RICCO|nr:very-long-chain aldehyde decarbonylase CER1 [Ricinus communis]EEF35903.1 sterol desaturase, putative [Ricinus communis]|eukprot:XP_002526512.1 protein ECERIFERUM 1 [Ricinus communis]
MASMPGVFSEWPWKPLGSFKHVVLAPWVINHIYSIVVKGEKENPSYLIFPFLLWRMVHNQLWISLSRYRTAKGNNRIIDKGIEFDQVDRERNWDDQVLLNGILFYVGAMVIPQANRMPMWRADSIIITILLHIGPVEFLYYWFHRLLHHHYLYSRYHSHHHSSIVTEPITSVIHPFAEHLAYFILFAIPLLTTVLSGTASVAAYCGYITYIDFMNNMGHCNFELIPKSFFSIFPPLKYLMYTPSFHSLHHTQFRTNYSLFMPIYDYIYGTMDKSSDSLYESSLKRQEEIAHVVHLTHMTTPDSIYHLRLGFAYLASIPQSSKWYLWLMWPVTLWTMIFARIYGRTFLLERHRFDKLRLQTWVIPKYKIQYTIQWQNESINKMIEQSILEAEAKGVKVLSLGLLNQGEELNRYGEAYMVKHPRLGIKVVDGSSLAVAVVLNSIPKGTTQLLFRGRLSKVAFAVVLGLCQRGIQVATTLKEDYEKLIKASPNSECGKNVLLSKNYSLKTWLVDDGLREEEQKKASKGTVFIPVSQFPPKKARNDCFYYSTPAVVAPSALENVDSCENWLPRRVMSAWRAAGIVHGLEGWNVNECGYTMFDVDRVWQATLCHGFKPLLLIPSTQF